MHAQTTNYIIDLSFWSSFRARKLTYLLISFVCVFVVYPDPFTATKADVDHWVFCWVAV